MEDVAFEGLPDPQPGELVIWVFGPGPGESQVVALPDGRWLVIDGCGANEGNWPLRLLAHHRVECVDLLVLTHPDRDHLLGIKQVLSSHLVTEVWRYPYFGERRDILARMSAGTTRPLWQELHGAIEAIDQLIERNDGFSVGLDDRRWPQQPSDYNLHVLAPCPADVAAEHRRLRALFERVARGDLSLSTEDENILIPRRLAGHGNGLSMALCLRWRGVGVLFAADLETVNAGNRGWRGLRAYLHKRNRGAELEAMRLVKIAHHGSDGAYLDDAWADHARGSLDLQAILTPFNRAPGQPPHRKALRQIQKYASELHVTQSPHAAGWGEIEEAGWRRTIAVSCSEAPVVAFRIDATGAIQAYHGEPSRRYTRPGT